MQKPLLNHPLGWVVILGSLGLVACGGGGGSGNSDGGGGRNGRAAPQETIQASDPESTPEPVPESPPESAPESAPETVQEIVPAPTPAPTPEPQQEVVQETPWQEIPTMDVSYVLGEISRDSDETTKLITASPRQLTPALVRAAYGLDLVHNPANPATMGQGQTIAIIAAYHNPGIAKDLATFSHRFSLPACASGCFSVVYTRHNMATTQAPPISKIWAVESSLDVLWAHATAPLAKIILVEAASNAGADMFAAASYASKTLGASVVNMSFGVAEWPGTPNATRYYFNSTNASFVTSSGDSGYHVQFPASSPSVLSVGGSNLSLTITGRYIGETGWTGAGGGISAYEAGLPAAWPNTTAAGLVSAWQNAAATKGGRPVPDVALHAAPILGYHVISESGFGAGNSASLAGTSAAAPQWAGFVAIANALRLQQGKQAFSTVPGAANRVSLQTALAQISAQPGGAAGYLNRFNDVATTLTPRTNCGLYCNAAPGRDMVTGLGTPKLGALIPALVAY